MLLVSAAMTAVLHWSPVWLCNPVLRGEWPCTAQASTAAGGRFKVSTHLAAIGNA